MDEFEKKYDALNRLASMADPEGMHVRLHDRIDEAYMARDMIEMENLESYCADVIDALRHANKRALSPDSMAMFV